MAIPAYAGFEDELRATTPLTIDSFLQHAKGIRKELDPRLIENARRRARQGFDGSTMTHAWRVVNRQLWNWLTTECPVEFDLRGAGLIVWNDFLDMSERYVSAIMDAFFAAQSELQAGQLNSRRAALDVLLDGRSSDQTGKILHGMGIRSERILIAACSFSGHGPADLAEPSFAFESLLREMKAHIRQLPWTVFHKRLILCLPYNAHTRESLAQLPDRLETTMHIGISRPSPITGSLRIPTRQAELALRGADGATRLVDFGRLSLVQIGALQADLQVSDVPPDLEAFIAEDAKGGHEWVRTAQALTNSQGNISHAASSLQVHPNTIYYRLTAAREICGLDLRSPSVLADIQFIQACRDFGTYVP